MQENNLIVNPSRSVRTSSIRNGDPHLSSHLMIGLQRQPLTLNRSPCFSMFLMKILIISMQCFASFIKRTRFGIRSQRRWRWSLPSTSNLAVRIINFFSAFCKNMKNNRSRSRSRSPEMHGVKLHVSSLPVGFS